MKNENRLSRKRRLTPQILFSELMAAYPWIPYGKTRKIRALAKQRGISVEAMLLQLLKIGLKKMAEKDGLPPKEPPTMPPTERAPILKEIDLMVAARSKKGDTREYVDASSLTDQEHASIIEEIKSGRLPKREKGESREQFLKRDAEYRAWIREAWERLGHPKYFSKTRKRVAILLVEREMAISVAAAEAMIRAGLIQDHYGRRITDTKARCPENAQIKLRSDQLINPLAVFARRDRKPAISSTTHSRVLDPDGCDDYSLSPDSTLICQEDLVLWILRRRQFREMDEPIAIALSKGATVEKGVHTAELLPARNEDGSVCLKLLVR